MSTLTDQLGWCITTQDYLNDLNQELKFVAQQYQSSVDELQNYNYIDDWLPIIESLCEEFDREIDDMVRYVESEHVEYVNNGSIAIQEELQI